MNSGKFRRSPGARY